MRSGIIVCWLCVFSLSCLVGKADSADWRDEVAEWIIEADTRPLGTAGLILYYVSCSSNALSLCITPSIDAAFAVSLQPCVLSLAGPISVADETGWAWASALAEAGKRNVCRTQIRPRVMKGGSGHAFALARAALKVDWDYAKTGNRLASPGDTIYHSVYPGDLCMAIGTSDARARFRISTLDSMEVYDDIPPEALTELQGQGFTPAAPETTFYDLEISLSEASGLTVQTSSFYPVSHTISSADFCFDADTLRYCGPDSILVPIVIIEEAFAQASGSFKTDLSGETEVEGEGDVGVGGTSWGNIKSLYR